MTKYFTSNDVWNGGFYELALELGERSDVRLLSALTALWQNLSLKGCYLEREQEPADQVKLIPSEEMLRSGQHLLGLARLPNKTQVACGTVAIREDNGPDWLDFYLPMGALAQAYDVGGYPFDIDNKSPESWQKPIDDYLAEIGKFVFSAVPFKLGLIGHEVSGNHYAEEIAEQGIPDERYIGYLWPSGGKLNYFPRNKAY
jgi:hypothetical protein